MPSEQGIAVQVMEQFTQLALIVSFALDMACISSMCAFNAMPNIFKALASV